MRESSALPISTLLAVCALCPVLIAANKSTEVDVVVDFTPAGLKIAHPTPGNPAFYYPVLSGFQELGRAVAGEKPPRPQDVAHRVALELSTQGYLEMKPAPYVNKAGQVTYKDGTVLVVPANPQRGQLLELNVTGGVPLTLAMLEAPDSPYYLNADHFASVAGAKSLTPAIEALQMTDPAHGPVMNGTPTLILFIQLGCIYPDAVSTAPVFGNKGDIVAPPTSFLINQSQLLGLVGGDAFKSGDVLAGGDDIYQRAQYDRYFIMLNAYDFQTYKRNNSLVLLWQAKMSCISDGVVQFADVLDALVSAGGPYFGRETSGPRFVTLKVTPEGHVEIGEPREVKP